MGGSNLVAEKSEACNAAAKSRGKLVRRQEAAASLNLKGG